MNLKGSDFSVDLRSSMNLKELSIIMIGVRDRRGKHVNINTFGINVEKQSRLKGIAGLAPI